MGCRGFFPPLWALHVISCVLTLFCFSYVSLIRCFHPRSVVAEQPSELIPVTTHNTRSVSRVTDISSTESSDSAQPNGSASDHPTLTPGATSPIIPRRSRDCRNLRRGTLPESSSPTPANRRPMKKHRQQPIQPPGIWQWSQKCTPSVPTRLGI